MEHRRLEYRHALRAVVYLRMLAGERSPNSPIGTDRWGNEYRSDFPPISTEDLEELRARVELLVQEAAKRLAQ